MLVEPRLLTDDVGWKALAPDTEARQACVSHLGKNLFKPGAVQGGEGTI
jgi:hypothetical protein